MELHKRASGFGVESKTKRAKSGFWKEKYEFMRWVLAMLFGLEPEIIKRAWIWSKDFKFLQEERRLREEGEKLDDGKEGSSETSLKSEWRDLRDAFRLIIETEERESNRIATQFA